jgi:hypothetical protein
MDIRTAAVFLVRASMSDPWFAPKLDFGSQAATGSIKPTHLSRSYS